MMDDLFFPRSIAVVGASNREYSIGNRVIKNLIKYNYTGKIYPVNPKADHILGLKSFKSILDIPTEIDTVHIVIKSHYIPSIIEECGRKKVKNIIINSSGFNEIGEEGKIIQDEILAISKKHGIRIMGPNCQGVINSDPIVNLYSNFTFTPLKKGRISIIAQSGGIGEIINNKLFESSEGIRIYASNGNASDISINELLEYLGEDKETKVILLHIENFTEVQNFIKISRDIVLRKPILAIKSGTTEEGAKAVNLHTGALVNKDVTSKLIFEKCGILSFDNIEEMCNTAIFMTNCKLPKGNKVGIITNTGGPAIISTDVVISNNLQLGNLTLSENEKIVDIDSTVVSNNPLDLLATADASKYEKAILLMDACKNIDLILINFITPFFVNSEEVARVIVKLTKEISKPIITALMTNKTEYKNVVSVFYESGIPYLEFPEISAKVIANMCEYNSIKMKLEKSLLENKAFNDDMSSFSYVGECANLEYISTIDSYEILSEYGLAIPKTFIYNNIHAVKYPVVLKVDSKNILHKTEVGGIIKNINNRDDLNKAIEFMCSKFGKSTNFIVQEQKHGSHEFIIGVKKEPNLGHIVMVGYGGIFVELFEDIACKLHPISESDAKEMIYSLKASKLFEGFRSSKPIDVNPIIQALLNISKLISDYPEISQLDINPILYSDMDESFYCVDVKILKEENKK